MPRNTVRERRPLETALLGEAPIYKDGLIVRLELSSVLAPTPVLLSGHNLRHFELDLRSYGFSGELSFLVSDDIALRSTDLDDLLALFRAPDLIKLRLTLQPSRADQEINIAPPPLELNGLVLERAMTEHVADLGNAPVSYRHYYVRFADAAQALWRQHFPCELFTQKSLRDVIEAHRSTHIVIEYPDLDVTRVCPMIFLGCDAEHRGGERASFYDLLMWRLDEMGKVLVYDYTRKVYQIHGAKPTPLPFDIIPHDVERIVTYYPDYPRYQKNVVNDFVESTQNRLVDNLKKVMLVRQDHLFNTEILSEFEQEVQRRTRAFLMPQPTFLVHYHAFPTKPYAPNVGVDWNLDLLDFAAEDIAIPLEAKAGLCRVYRMQISGRSDETDVRMVYDGLVPATFHLRTTVLLEQATDRELRLPAYTLPRYPVAIEGRVVSEAGAAIDETYQFYPDAVNRLPKYKVMIPLWANQIITTPYNPNTLPGQFYFPAYKYERILVDLYFDRAMIREFREWRATAQLPLESQGDQLLLGKTPINRTSLSHFYENERPVFEIERLNQLDSELVKIAEGNLLLQVGIPPVGAVSGTTVGRKIVMPLGLPAVPPRGSPPMPGGLPTSTAPLGNRPGTTASPTQPASPTAPPSTGPTAPTAPAPAPGGPTPPPRRPV